MTSEVFVVASNLYARFEYPVALQNVLLLATARDWETDVLDVKEVPVFCRFEISN